MSLPTDQNSALTHAKRAKSLRGVLLGAAAAASLAVSAGMVLPLAARAEAPVTQGMAAVGPASFADMVDRVKGAVVSVKVTTIDKAEADMGEGPSLPPGMPPLSPDDPLYRFFKRFGGPHGEARPHKGQAQGSGFIISSDGYVVTNNHVVENATDVSVTLDGGKTVSAKVIGTDKKTDLALLKINEAGTYPYVQFSGETPRVGDWVIAVGNPFGLGGTVTAGIVSARGRDIGSGPYDDYLQIDAPVNRGNSGGPTFNTRGDVVGVNTAIFSPSGGSVGIGFAIPSEVAKDVVAALKDKGAVTRGYIGVQIQPVTQDIADSLGLKSTKGALVAQTQPNTPAGKAGIASGDVITAVNGEKVDGPRELSRKIAALGPDATAQLTYIHNGSEKIAAVKLGQLPAEKEARLDAPKARGGRTELAKFGMSLAPAADVPNAGREGAAVADLDPDGVAAQKGLRTGDVILDAGGKPVTGPEDIVAALDTARKDGRSAVLLRVKTGDNTHFLALPTNPS
ncbi:serine protease Do [Rhodoblastus acidophilus]|uniref:Probable periplasmic serine endoprotease DegP-like n=1 Tax=Rhodoblastus acidophilus TaxID=1074 RepID=A0A212QNI4_RHOAC|nr:Do family serine endopeptidase [Rhodoblastus acidophilus]PPQ39003.1 serine peptidase [Rhodoblastus acidophilus]RAI20127.1 serine peptidase [Rhodoblastus acidophilus]SNB60976.1 serine protease Do [Rhodoblastus acidophilus]